MVPIQLSNLKAAGLELIEADFLHALSTAVVDVQERPGEEKPRKVVLTWELRPAANQRGICEEVKLDVTCQTQLPKTNAMGQLTTVPHAQGQLFIRAGSPDEPDQMSFIDSEPIQGEE